MSPNRTSSHFQPVRGNFKILWFLQSGVWLLEVNDRVGWGIWLFDYNTNSNPYSSNPKPRFLLILLILPTSSSASDWYTTKLITNAFKACHSATFGHWHWQFVNQKAESFSGFGPSVKPIQYSGRDLTKQIFTIFHHLCESRTQRISHKILYFWKCNSLIVCDIYVEPLFFERNVIFVPIKSLK